MAKLSIELVEFLKKLAKNNNRDWFNERKPTYKKHESEAKELYQIIAEKLRATDDIEGYKIMRIYRDVRFSKDKTPFKPRFAGSFKRATEALRGGYFLNIEPGNCCAGGGFYAPNPKDLLRIRKEFSIDATQIRKILADVKFKIVFPDGLLGDEVKTAPKGFSKEDEAIDLIRKKQFYVMRTFTDEEMLSEDFTDKIMEVFVTLRPFFDYMSEVLTTNLNGESILNN